MACGGKGSSARSDNERDPDIVGLCETHLNRGVATPVIDGYKWFGNNGTGRSCWVRLYLKEEIRQVSEIQGTGEEKDKGRIICVRLGDLAVVEEYAPVGSEAKETGEEFYQVLLGHIAKAKGMTNSLILIGDFNADVAG